MYAPHTLNNWHTRIIDKSIMSALLKVLTFLLVSSPSISLALGLGELELKSNLGEPLSAQITISDTDSLPELSCLSVNDASQTPAFKKARLTLKKVNDKSILYISTAEAITEPILNLSVAVHCEPNINREYVVLLDPAPLNATAAPAAPATTGPEGSNEKPATSKAKTRAAKHIDPAAAEAAYSTPPQQTTTKKKKNKAKPSAAQLLDESYTGKAASNSTTAATQKPATTDAAPPPGKAVLIISGNNQPLPALSLRLDTQIDINRVETTPAQLSSADAQDEVTVMTNRLAHMEKQILSLQTQNARLKSEAEQAAQHSINWAALTPSKQEIWLILAIIAALMAALWLRRRIMLKRLDNEAALWFEPEAEASDDLLPDSLAAERAGFSETKPGIKSGAVQDRNAFAAYPTAFTVNEHDDNESVLDHADVFIAHDRPAMAIQLLQNHLVDLPLESPEIWLKLISLLALEGTEEEYNHAVAACKKFFNVKLPDFAHGTSEDTSSIEDYPHIMLRLQDVWGSEFAVEFLNDLIYNKQAQPREGFGCKTFEDLFFLKQIAMSTHATNKGSAKASAATPPHAAPVPTTPAVQQTQAEEPEILTAAAFFDAPDAVEHDFQVSSYADDKKAATNKQSEGSLALDLLFGADEEEPVAKVNPKSSAIELALNSAALDTSVSLEAEEIDFSSFLEEITMEAPAEEAAMEMVEDKAPTENASETEQPKSSAPLTIEWELPELKAPVEEKPAKK